MREAIQQLQSQGLLEVRHGVGVRIINQLHRPLSASLRRRLPDARERLRQLIEMRLLIEPGVARLAAERADESHMERMQAAQEKLRAACDMATAVECDMEFHRELARASGNDVLALILESAADLGRESRSLTISRYGAERAYAQHEQIVAAIQNRRPDDAEAAMRRNLITTSGELDDVLVTTGGL
jgi:GntR family transcriptional repressor for pyruvate dehydrogenase complex